MLTPGAAESAGFVQVCAKPKFIPPDQVMGRRPRQI